MRERFKRVKTEGDIKISLSENRVWIDRKENIIKNIIEITNDYISLGYSMTLRQLYYQLVSKDLIPNHDKVYQKISSIKDECVYGGFVDWSVFEDRGRVPVISYFENSVSEALERTKNWYSLDKQRNQKVHVEVWTEKDAISDILKRVTNKYTIRLVVNKGYSSSTAMYASYLRFKESIKEGKKVKILYFGDHDPSGLDMIRDIYERITFMLFNGESQEINEMYEDWWEESGKGIYDVTEYEEKYEAVVDLLNDISDSKRDRLHELFDSGAKEIWLKENDLFEVIPIGLTMDQIKEFKPPYNPAKITDPRAKGYVRKYGGKSWEVDALHPDSMTEIVEKNILENIDEDVLKEVIELEEKDRRKISRIIESLNG